MYGDFEAQRHWIELTGNLPVTSWYTYNTSYWGLDYPPLTAYHSLLLYHTSPNKTWFQLDTSHGCQDENLILFMRLAALLTEFFIYTTAVLVYTSSSPNKLKQFVLLWNPVLSIIDHGHFQFNSAMIGLSLWAFILIQDGNFVASAFVFTLALFFKQVCMLIDVDVTLLCFTRLLYSIIQCFQKEIIVLIY